MAEHRISNPRYTNVTTTLSETEAEALAKWMAKQDPPVTRSAALRHFVLAGLGLKE
jgi:hypothetical protein